VGVALIGGACSTFGTGASSSSSSGGTPDAASDAGEVDGEDAGFLLPDGGEPPPPPLNEGCRAKPFGAPQPLKVSDGLEITSIRIPRNTAYVSTKLGEIYSYRVNGLGEPSTSARALKIELRPPTAPNHPFVLSDEKSILFQADDTTTSLTRIWRSNRDSASQEWNDAVDMGLAPASTKMLEPYVAGLHLYVGMIFGAQIEKIARTTRNGGVFDNSPDSISEINGGASDSNGFPVVASDELEIFFWSSRSGGGDIYRATRPDKNSTFSAPALVSELSTPDLEDRPTFLSSDTCTLFVTRKTNGDQFTAFRFTR